MTSGLLSDTHADFYISVESTINQRRLSAMMDKYLKGISLDVLLMPGDIGHYNRQSIDFLKAILDHYDVGQIVATIGNHELYLLSKSARSNYVTSLRKIDSYKELLSNVPNVTLLDGDVTTISGIRIGGTCGWYDDSYYRLLSPGPYSPDIHSLWRNYSNDSLQIYPRLHYYETMSQELDKVKSVLEQGVDIMLTHICPVSDPSIPDPKHKDDLSTTFYCFDGAHLIEKYSPKVWVYGHMHSPHSTTVHSTILARNPMGYPGELCTANSLYTFTLPGA